MNAFERASNRPEEIARVVSETLVDYRRRPDWYASIKVTNETELRAWVERYLAEGTVYMNDDYTVTVYDDAGPEDWPTLLHLSIKRNDRAPIRDWRELQAIKNALLGPEHEAVELFPAESRKVDTANQYHLFALKSPDARFPFGFTTRLVSDDVGPTSRAKQRPGAEAAQ